MAVRVAVVEDDATQASLLEQLLVSEGYSVVTFPDGEAALKSLEAAGAVDVVLSDVSMPKLDGLQLCQALKQVRPELPVILVTAESRLETAVAALRAGAWDFVSKPIEPELVASSVARAAERQRLLGLVRAANEATPAQAMGLFGESDSMRRVRELVARVAPSGASVLIHGETGTGKELVARALHQHSPRAKAPFVAINCAALPAALVESELFGYAKGAFTDARGSRQGLFVEAEGGTLFLDEIAELTLDNQAKLLRALQERTVRPLGSNTEVPFDARILAATHRDLAAEVTAGRFRQDLFYRLNVIRIDLPPLRDRGVDVVHLAARFLESICARDKRAPLTIEHDIASRFLTYAWPGNVRELENCIERLVALAPAEVKAVRTADLPEPMLTAPALAPQTAVETTSEIVTLDEVERRYVLQVLKLVGDNRSKAAQLLGIDRRTLYRRLEGWGLPTEREGSEAT